MIQLLSQTVSRPIKYVVYQVQFDWRRRANRLHKMWQNEIFRNNQLIWQHDSLYYLWRYSEIDWKHSCLTLTRSSVFAVLANLGYTSDIIIVIIIIIIIFFY